jgi:hypothetical protein
MIKPADGSCAATSPGFRKMPAPTVPPTEPAKPKATPSTFDSPPAAGVSVGPFWLTVDVRLPLHDAPARQLGAHAERLQSEPVRDWVALAW